MATTKRFVLFLLILALPVGFWGYAYEASYFLALDLSPHKTLSVWHYVVSGGGLILLMLVPLLVLANLRKFFTKAIHEDDIKSLKDHLARAELSEEIKGARVAVALSAAFWLAVYFRFPLPMAGHLHSIYLYMVFVNLALFFSSIAISPPYARGSVLIAFIASVAICFSAGGYGDAVRSRDGKDLLRDDNIVRIERLGGRPVATAKDLPLPTSWSDALLRLLR